MNGAQIKINSTLYENKIKVVFFCVYHLYKMISDGDVAINSAKKKLFFHD
jgi:hypothetical protein